MYTVRWALNSKKESLRDNQSTADYPVALCDSIFQTGNTDSDVSIYLGPRRVHNSFHVPLRVPWRFAYICGRILLATVNGYIMVYLEYIRYVGIKTYKIL